MKAELIANIIAAHCSGNENSFKTAVDALAADEDKKGNSRVSSMLLDAYKGKDITLMKKPDIGQLAGGGFAVQSAGCNSFTPRDKDSLLELYDVVHSDISLSDVVLPENQRKLILQILEERQNNSKLAKHNLPAANRLLLCGPPGCGKTMTAHSIAHELNLPMAYVRIDGLVSSYLGQTSVNLRKIFSSVGNQNIILFLDEFDAIAKKRDDGHEMGELKRVVTALLQNFDNMPPNVFLIAATNHEHLLDPAIFRRFNYTINIGYPDADQRSKLIQRWFKEYIVETEVDVQKLTDLTVDRSVAQIKELVISAAKRYVTTDKPVTMEDMIELLIQQMTNNSNGAGLVDAAASLKVKGVSVRTLAKAIGVPHNTLSYQINKLTKGKEVNE
ncbi:MAG: ATP-binding protein [Oscillospiraceae bacterium]|nr:ATP-binding protein [Oscillospiraceae bacterium]